MKNSASLRLMKNASRVLCEEVLTAEIKIGLIGPIRPICPIFIITKLSVRINAGDLRSLQSTSRTPPFLLTLVASRSFRSVHDIHAPAVIGRETRPDISRPFQYSSLL